MGHYKVSTTNPKVSCRAVRLLVRAGFNGKGSSLSPDDDERSVLQEAEGVED